MRIDDDQGSSELLRSDESFLCGRFLFTEGPIWIPADRALLFSDIPGNRIHRWRPDGTLETYREPSGWSNGLTLDGQGNLLMCEHGGRRGNVTLNFASFLLRADGRTVLVDTGNGPEAQGKLMDELQQAGVAAEAIDTVVFTHLHGDHTGWNLERGSATPRFPNARYLVPRADWEHYQAQTPSPDSFARDIVPLDGLGVLELIEGEHAISPSLVTLPTPGHTPGHTTVVVSSGGEEAYVLGDAFLTPIDVAEPDWATSWDWAAGPVRATRRMLLERITASNALVAASHLPVPGLGRFVMTGHRRTFRVVMP